MSTVTTLLAYEAAQPPMLVRFVPRLRGKETERRKLTVMPDLYRWMSEPVKGANLSSTKANARVHLGQFVKGEPIDDCRFMKRVEDRRLTPPDFDHEVWSISPRFGDPQYRFFGAFVTKDWFLAVSKQDRNRLEEHQNRWHEEIDKVIRTWNVLFNNGLRHSGKRLLDYVSAPAEHCDGRW
jgi:hypothetical protein